MRPNIWHTLYAINDTGGKAMKVCIYGAGAIGGYLGVQLAQAGADVSLVARGAHLEAMRQNGVKPVIDGEERVAAARYR